MSECPKCGLTTAKECEKYWGHLAECMTCGRLFPCEPRSTTSEPSSRTIFARTRYGFQATYHWDRAVGVLLAFGSLLISVPLSLLIAETNADDFHAHVAVLFLILMWLPGNFVALAQLLNRTSLVLDGRELQVKNGPISLKKEHRLNFSDIDTFFITRNDVLGVDSHKYRSYGLRSGFKDGSNQALISPVQDPDQVMFLLIQLEEALEQYKQRRPVG